MVISQEAAKRLQALENQIAQGRQGIRRERRIARQLAIDGPDGRRANELVASLEDRLFQAVIHAESLRAALIRVAVPSPANIFEPVAVPESTKTAGLKTRA